MSESKACPKCKGAMAQGRIMKFNEYTARKGQYMYVFAPDDESGPDLSKMFSGKPLSSSRKALVAFACAECGFTELYSQAVS